MKLIKYISIPVLVLAFAFTGCKKELLDITPLSAINPDDFFKNEKEASAALTGVYSSLDEMWISFDAMSDDLYNQYPWEGPTEFGDGTFNPTSGYVIRKWAINYIGIGRANLFIDNMVKKANFDKATMDRMIGEAKYLRAFWYADLADFYEDVPLILAPQSLADANTAKSTKVQVVTQVLKDLDAAIITLPISYGPGDAGRATKGAAMALKARVLLYNQKWAEAAAAAKSVMDMNQYSLYPNYGELFTLQAENNQEVIFDVPYIKDKRPHGYTTTIRDWRSYVPFVQLSNDYYMNNGKPITDPTSGFNPANPFKNRDPRLNMTLVVPGEIYNGAKYIPANDISPTGMAIRKMVEEDNFEYWNGQINLILLRYADVLLMYAEAQNEVAGPDASVYDAIHKVRQRAGMPDVADGLSKDAMRNEIRHERRIEFVAEGLRYSDIRRWKIASTVMVNGLGYKSDKLSDPSVPSKWVFEVIVANSRVFSAPKNYVWPLPQSEIQTNKKLVQNPLWK